MNTLVIVGIIVFVLGMVIVFMRLRKVDKSFRSIRDEKIEKLESKIEEYSEQLYQAVRELKLKETLYLELIRKHLKGEAISELEKMRRDERQHIRLLEKKLETIRDEPGDERLKVPVEKEVARRYLNLINACLPT